MNSTTPWRDTQDRPNHEAHRVITINKLTLIVKSRRSSLMLCAQRLAASGAKNSVLADTRSKAAGNSALLANWLIRLFRSEIGSSHFASRCEWLVILPPNRREERAQF
jgi:hypothetical protein